MKLANYTPHAVNIGDVVLPSEGVARVRTSERAVGYAMPGVPLVAVEYGEVDGLPEPAEGIMYIVSKITADALPDRADLLYPGRLVRDGEGVPVGCSALVLAHPAAPGVQAR